MLVAVLESRHHAVGVFDCPAEVDHVEPTIGGEYPESLDQHLSLHVGVEVVEHERRNHAVKRSVAVRQALPEAVVELNGEVAPAGLASGS